MRQLQPFYTDLKKAYDHDRVRLRCTSTLRLYSRLTDITELRSQCKKQFQPTTSTKGVDLTSRPSRLDLGTDTESRMRLQADLIPRRHYWLRQTFLALEASQAKSKNKGQPRRVQYFCQQPSDKDMHARAQKICIISFQFPFFFPLVARLLHVE